MEDGLDKAMQQWRGFEYIWHQGVSHRLLESGEERPSYTNPISFDLRGRTEKGAFSATMQIHMGRDMGEGEE